MNTKQQQVRELLVELHAANKPGDRLAPERALAEQWGISRPTLRAAIDDLAAEGYFIRKQGSGTYVQEPRVAQALALVSFSEDMRQRGMEPETRLLHFGSEAAGPKVGARLEISPRDTVWSIKRLRLADGRPMAIEHSHVPTFLVPALTAEEVGSGSLYRRLANTGTAVAGGIQTIEPTVTTQEESALLDVAAFTPALLFERTTHTDGGLVVEFARSIYRGDRYKLVAEIRPPKS